LEEFTTRRELDTAAVKHTKVSENTLIDTAEETSLACYADVALKHLPEQKPAR
jgi:hypothetical protein